MPTASNPRESPLAESQSSTLTPSALLRLLHDEKALTANLPVALCLDDYRVLVIDCDPASHNGRSLRWRSWTLSGLPEFRSRIARNAGITLDVGPIDRHVQPGTPTCAGSLKELIWATATHAPNLQPGMRMDDLTRFELAHWPDFSASPASVNQMRVAAAISHRSLSVADIVAQTEVPLVEVVGFLNACHWSGWLLTDVDPPPSSAPTGTLSEPATSGAQRFGAFLRGLRAVCRRGAQALRT